MPRWVALLSDYRWQVFASTFNILTAQQHSRMEMETERPISHSVTSLNVGLYICKLLLLQRQSYPLLIKTIHLRTSSSL